MSLIGMRNNRAEQSHEPTRVRERGMRRFKTPGQAQRFLNTHAAVSNLFNLGRHLISANHYRKLKAGAFNEWGPSLAPQLPATGTSTRVAICGVLCPGGLTPLEELPRSVLATQFFVKGSI
jgi:hypothetical protein